MAKLDTNRTWKTSLKAKAELTCFKRHKFYFEGIGSPVGFQFESHFSQFHSSLDSSQVFPDKLAPFMQTTGHNLLATKAVARKSWSTS